MSNLKECLHQRSWLVSDNHRNYGIDSPDLLISTIQKIVVSAFDFEEFNDGICVPAYEIRWQIFCHIHVEDKKLDAHLRAAPSLPLLSPPPPCK